MDAGSSQVTVYSRCPNRREALAGRRCRGLFAPGRKDRAAPWRPWSSDAAGHYPGGPRSRRLGGMARLGAELKEGRRAVYRWQGLDDVPADWGASVVTIGEFDGVHRGHQYVVARAAELGRERGLPVVAITFDPHPDEVVRPGSHPPLLCSARRRAELLVSLG